jgi:hypothetical protein
MNVLNKDMNEIINYKYLDINGDNIKIRWAGKKFPESFAIDGLVHYEFVPPVQSYCASSAGRDSGVCTEPHITVKWCILATEVPSSSALILTSRIIKMASSPPSRRPSYNFVRYHSSFLYVKIRCTF